MYKICLSLIVAFALPSIASANGGNGGKNNGSIEVKNTSSSQFLLVAVDPSSSLSQATDANEFTTRGGRILEPGTTTVFKDLKVGSHSVVSTSVPAGTTTVNPSAFNNRSVNVTKGGKVKLNL